MLSKPSWKTRWPCCWKACLCDYNSLVSNVSFLATRMATRRAPELPPSGASSEPPSDLKK
eukprot:4386601-Pyramimonas_sp.AAC.1